MRLGVLGIGGFNKTEIMTEISVLLNPPNNPAGSSNHNFSTGGLSVETACPIWQDSGLRGVKKEFSRLHKQLG